MHVCFFTPAFPPFIGGGERYARSLALALAERGVKITVVTSQALGEEQLWLGTGNGMVIESDGPLTVIRCAVRPMPGGWRGLLAWRKAMVLLSLLPGSQARLLGALARRFPALVGLEQALRDLPQAPSLVHGFNLSWEYPALVAGDFARRRDLPFALTPFMHFGGGPGQMRMARNTTMDHQQRLLRQAQAVLVLTDEERRGLAQWGIDTQRVAPVGGGVDEPPAIGDALSAVADLKLQRPYALFVGRVNRDKGAIDAATATLQLIEQGHPLTLALAGRAADDFERFYARLSGPARERVRLLGRVDETTKHALMQEATMLVLPSQVESFGIVILEAWQHETPVVASRAGGVPGVVDDGVNGLLAPYGDVEALSQAMRRLLCDEHLRRELGRKGRQKVRRDYTWDAVAQRVMAVYREVTA